MTTRIQRALRLGLQVGGIMTAVAATRYVALAFSPGLTTWERLVSPLAAPLATFVFFFSLVFVIGYAFPPTTDQFGKGLRFPRARWVIWPLVALAAAVIIYIRIIKRQ